jgi:Nucleotidyl transferase AbiEii toxin, Type IV TA system
MVHQPRSRHPRTGGTALSLPTTTELLIIDLISQHDPQANPQLTRDRHTRLPQALLHQFAAIETLQLRIAARRMSAGLIPKKAQQRITLFGDFAEPSASSTRALLRNESYVAGQRLAIDESLRVPKKHIRCQRRDPSNACFSEIMTQAVDDDGLVFDPKCLRVARIKEEQEYEGLRVNLVARLERARIHMQVDVGFGGVIVPPPKEIQYPAMLNFPIPHLRAYPREAVVAESSKLS